MERCLNCGENVVSPYAYVSQGAVPEGQGEFVICSPQCAMQFSHLEYAEKKALIAAVRGKRVLE